MRQKLVAPIVCSLVFLLFARSGTAEVEPLIPCSPEPTNMSITYGNIVDCSLEVVGDSDVFRFTGNAGETIAMNVYYTSAFVGVSLFDISGTPVPLSGSPNPTFGFYWGLLPTGGTYTLLLHSVSGFSTGDYVFTFERVGPPSPTARPIQYGESITGEWNPAGDADVLFFAGTAGDVIAISLQGEFHVFAPDGTVLLANWGGSPLPLMATLLQTGTYTILVETVTAEIREYTATLQCISGVYPPTAPLPVGGVVTGVKPGQVVCKNLATGQTLTLRQRGARSWDCKAAGLVIQQGERVQQTVTGRAD